MRIVREIAGGSQQYGGDRSCPLQYTGQDHPPNIIRERPEYRPRNEEQQSKHQNRLASQTVRGATKRKLQQGLGQSIDADGKPKQKGRLSRIEWLSRASTGINMKSPSMRVM